jgi:hypothetical protein
MKNKTLVLETTIADHIVRVVPKDHGFQVVAFNTDQGHEDVSQFWPDLSDALRCAADLVVLADHYRNRLPSTPGQRVTPASADGPAG